MQEVGKIQERLSDPSFILNLTEEKIKSIEQGEVMGKMTFDRIFKDLKQIPIEMLSTFLFDFLVSTYGNNKKTYGKESQLRATRTDFLKKLGRLSKNSRGGF